ncbi:methyltransferase type 11 [Mucilaginibacter sp. BJC16-A38]|uniref:methyltransferase type 11 n=1 Tax=Mucilaginibacter phenanthrenivorans TaxID=1234842 RepID=UPI0021581394|nr:methyltransferase type 11 [Mucilaginibacter phenanthrenivorans]MCR8556638.1 methyltransferase type 11 [Mucilaginibacter phenanthrenivorans]
MVEIFKTNVKSKRLAGKVLKSLQSHLPAFQFNFDLDDCDRILRVQTSGCPVECVKIIHIVKGYEIDISLFED